MTDVDEGVGVDIPASTDTVRQERTIDGQAKLIVRVHCPRASVDNRDSLNITWEPVNCVEAKHRGETLGSPEAWLGSLCNLRIKMTAESVID